MAAQLKSYQHSLVLHALVFLEYKSESQMQFASILPFGVYNVYRERICLVFFNHIRRVFFCFVFFS